MPSVPTYCLATSAIAAGAVLATTQLHDTRVPKSCVASSLAGTTALTVALTHHSSSSTSPPWYCVIGGVGGLAAICYALTSHAEISAIPTKCKIATATGVALMVVGTIIAARK